MPKSPAVLQRDGFEDTAYEKARWDYSLVGKSVTYVLGRRIDSGESHFHEEASIQLCCNLELRNHHDYGAAPQPESSFAQIKGRGRSGPRGVGTSPSGLYDGPRSNQGSAKVGAARLVLGSLG